MRIHCFILLLGLTAVFSCGDKKESTNPRDFFAEVLVDFAPIKEEDIDNYLYIAYSKGTDTLIRYAKDGFLEMPQVPLTYFKISYKGFAAEFNEASIEDNLIPLLQNKSKSLKIDIDSPPFYSSTHQLVGKRQLSADDYVFWLTSEDYEYVSVGKLEKVER